MLHPVFSTLRQRPDLVLNHGSAHAALFRQEGLRVGAEGMARVVARLRASLKPVPLSSMVLSMLATPGKMSRPVAKRHEHAALDGPVFSLLAKAASRITAGRLAWCRRSTGF